MLLPMTPDRSARVLREQLHARTQVSVGVIINDSWGRAWRRGVVGHALGVARLESVVDLRGRRDLNGRQLRATKVALADEGTPVVLVRGLACSDVDGDARALLRPRSEDLFR